jgi:ATP-dependent protease ClpP protease subunit
MNRWHNIRVRDGVARVLIFGELNAAHPFDPSALQDVCRAEVVIDSIGGDSRQAFDTFQALRALPHVEVTIKLASSGAALIAQAGHVRRIHASGQMMVHGAVTAALGSAADFRSEADRLDEWTAKMARLLRDRTRQPAEVIAGWLQRDTWFTADEAVSAGLADEVILERDAEVAPAIASNSDDCAAPTDEERLFFALLEAFPNLRVRSRESFARELNVFLSTTRTL